MDKNDTGQEKNSYTFYVGTYTNKQSRGIYKYLLWKDGSLKKIGLVTTSENPSFLTITANKRYLLAVNEIDNKGVGSVESFLITDDSLSLINRSSSGGAHPCFVTINEMGFVLTANYTSGNVGLLRLNKEGQLSSLLDVQTHSGSSTHKNQQGPHAHSAWFDPSDNTIIAVDLGTNDLWFSQLDTTLQRLVPSDPQKLAMKPGAGPRHLAIHPTRRWIYVLNELDCTITLVHKLDNGNYNKGVSVSTLPIDYSKPNTGADIHVSSDGKFVYASNRGHNSIAIFEVNAETGSLNLVGNQPTNGSVPRNFRLSPDDNFLLVANQQTNNIVSFKRNNITGMLTEVDQIDAPTPVCILF